MIVISILAPCLEYKDDCSSPLSRASVRLMPASWQAVRLAMSASVHMIASVKRDSLLAEMQALTQHLAMNLMVHGVAQ